MVLDERLQKQLEFILEIDKEKNILRQTHLSEHGRRENDAEHAWHMAIMVFLLKEYSNQEIDVMRTMQLCLIHDLVEIYAGDTYAYDEEGKKSQKEREAKAEEKLFSMLPDDQGDYMRELFHEFEAGGSDWREQGVSIEQVRGRQEKTKLGSEALYDITNQIMEENLKKGNLKP